MRASVSNLDTFRAWRVDEEQDLAALLAQLKGREVTAPMLRGRAFAKVMEKLELGEHYEASADGYTFVFTGDFTIPTFPRREESREKDYDGLTVSARCDRVIGKFIVDDKTTEQFDAEKYLQKFQWRYYLDIWNADQFLWNVWQMKELDANHYEVYALHTLDQWRYPEMEAECLDLAQAYREFAEKWLQPDSPTIIKTQLEASLGMR